MTTAMPSLLGRSWPAVVLFAVGASSLRCGGSSSRTVPGSHTSGTGGADAAGATGGSSASAGRANASGGSNPVGGDAGSDNAGRGGSTGGIGGTGGHVGVGGSGAGHVGSAGQAGKNASAGSGPTGGSTAMGGRSATGGEAGDQGTSGEGTDCDLGSDCGRGTCWEGLTGFAGCVNPTDPPPPAQCFGTEPGCCASNAECTAGTDGLCIPNIDTVLSCGGNYPAGNSCNYDACTDDSDCEAAQPADTTVATCLPRGALGQYTAACAYGVCRTDNDCTQSEGGQCLYGLAATHAGCDLRYVLYCAYSSDPCTDRYGSCNDTTKVCAPNDDFQGRNCVQAPPMYP